MNIVSTEGIDGKLHPIVIVMTEFLVSLSIEWCVLSYQSTSAWNQDIKQESGKGMSKVVSTCIFYCFLGGEEYSGIMTLKGKGTSEKDLSTDF